MNVILIFLIGVFLGLIIKHFREILQLLSKLIDKIGRNN